MAKTPLLEKAGSLRVLGAAFIVLMLMFVWLTYAFFNKQFVDSVPVTLTTSKSGMQLPSNADVKLKGMIVGEVRDVEPTADGVTMSLAMFPEMMIRIPREVTAQIIPKTVFGEKYVSLIPAENLSGETLQAGDNIARAEVPIEVETLLNNLYPLLEAVQPAELSFTLTAISEALKGRGDEIGDSLIKLNKYFIEIDPDIPLLVDDLVKLGEVSDGYADAMPDLGRFLKNSVVTGNTIVAKRAQMQAFFTEGIKLSDTTTRFLKDNGDNMITLAREGQPFLQVLSDYS
ncbi:MAG: MCE family protein, partial [Propionibacteriales bacterium]|nr:MCE family protein [Propionibacteriales bacterium]